MKILFKDSRGKKFTLNVEGSMKIEQVKLKVKNEIKSTKTIRLLFGGDVMKDGDNLDDYEVEDLNEITYTEEYQSGI